MTQTVENPFTPMQGHTPPEGSNTSGKPSLDAGAIARAAAQQAVQAADQQQQQAPPEPAPPSTIQPGGQFKKGGPGEHRSEEPPVPPAEPTGEEGQQAQQAQQSQEGQQSQQQQAQQQTQQTPPVPTITQEDLEAHGIELPVSPDEVPDEFRQTYDTLAQAVIDGQQRAEQVALDARQAIAQVQDFSERLNTPEGQRRMLLAMAMQNGDTFNEVAQQVQRMAEDPEYAESVRRQIEAEIKLEAASRKERAFNEQQINRKAQQVESRTVRLARQMGVDPEWAKSEVVNQILRNEAQTGKRDITLAQVDEVVQALARRSGAQRPQQVQTPQRQQQAAQTPQQPVQGAGQTPPPQPQQQQQGQQGQRQAEEAEHPMDRLRGAVMGAARRYSATQQS